MSPVRTAALAALLLTALLTLPAVAGAQPQRTTLAVAGMTCAGCENTIESVLESLGGVTAAQADRSTATVTVAYDRSATAPAALVAAINDNTYYRASLAAPTSAASAPVDEQAGSGSGPLLMLAVPVGAGGLVLLGVRLHRRRATGLSQSPAPGQRG